MNCTLLASVPTASTAGGPTVFVPSLIRQSRRKCTCSKTSCPTSKSVGAGSRPPSAFSASAWADRGRCGWRSSGPSYFPSSRGSRRPSNIMSFTARARPSTTCTTARSSAGRTRRPCTFIPAAIRRTYSFAAIRDDAVVSRQRPAAREARRPGRAHMNATWTTHAGGHSWQYFNHMADRAVRFLHAGLEQQSRPFAVSC